MKDHCKDKKLTNNQYKNEDAKILKMKSTEKNFGIESLYFLFKQIN